MEKNMSGEKMYILALDQGTTSSRAVIFDREINKVISCQEEFTQIYPKPGWVEHDPNELFQCQLNVMKKAIEDSKVDPLKIAALIPQYHGFSLICDSKRSNFKRIDF